MSIGKSGRNGAIATSEQHVRFLEAAREAGADVDTDAEADILDDLKSPPGNRLEALKGDREAQHSIRINDQFRICLRWTEAGPVDVEILTIS